MKWWSDKYLSNREICETEFNTLFDTYESRKYYDPIAAVEARQGATWFINPYQKRDYKIGAVHVRLGDNLNWIEGEGWSLTVPARKVSEIWVWWCKQTRLELLLQFEMRFVDLWEPKFMHWRNTLWTLKVLRHDKDLVIHDKENGTITFKGLSLHQIWGSMFDFGYLHDPGFWNYYLDKK